MKTNDIIELSIEKIVSGGDGVAYYSEANKLCGNQNSSKQSSNIKNKILIFVPLSAPGDIVKAKITEVKKDFARAEILEILKPSPDRIEAKCKLYGNCGGCNLMHISEKAQHKTKLSIVQELISRSGGIPGYDSDKLIINYKSNFSYRNRTQFHKTSQNKPAFTQRNSNVVIPIEHCPILVDPINNYLEKLNNDQKSSTNLFKTKERVNVFGQSDLSSNQECNLFIEGINKTAYANILSKQFSFDTEGFFQSNLEMLSCLVSKAVEGTGGCNAADIYCGAGLFASFLTDSFEHLYCVEQDKHSLGHASLNIKNNSACGNAFSLSLCSVEDWIKSEQAKIKFDYVMFDPPRNGLSIPVRNWIKDTKPVLVGYASCNPVSLVRDAISLVKSGYNVESFELFDFYPQTSHMEAYMRLSL